MGKICEEHDAAVGQLELRIEPVVGGGSSPAKGTGAPAHTPTKPTEAASVVQPGGQDAEVATEERSGAPPQVLARRHSTVEPEDVQAWWNRARRASRSPNVPELSLAAACSAAMMLRHKEHSELAQQVIEAYVGRWDAARAASGGMISGGPDIDLLVAMYGKLVEAILEGRDLARAVWRGHVAAAADPFTDWRGPSRPATRSDRDRLLDFAKRYRRRRARAATAGCATMT